MMPDMISFGRLPGRKRQAFYIVRNNTVVPLAFCKSREAEQIVEDMLKVEESLLEEAEYEY